MEIVALVGVCASAHICTRTHCDTHMHMQTHTHGMAWHGHAHTHACAHAHARALQCHIRTDFCLMIDEKARQTNGIPVFFPQSLQCTRINLGSSRLWILALEKLQRGRPNVSRPLSFLLEPLTNSARCRNFWEMEPCSLISECIHAFLLHLS